MAVAVAAAAAAGRVDLRKARGNPRVRSPSRHRPAPRGPLSPQPKLWVARGRAEGRGGRAGGPRAGGRATLPGEREPGAGLGRSRPAGARLRLQAAPLGARAAPPEGARSRGAGLSRLRKTTTERSPLTPAGGSWPPREPQTSRRRKYVEEPRAGLGCLGEVGPEEPGAGVEGTGRLPPRWVGATFWCVRR